MNFNPGVVMTIIMVCITIMVVAHCWFEHQRKLACAPQRHDEEMERIRLEHVNEEKKRGFISQMADKGYEQIQVLAAKNEDSDEYGPRTDTTWQLAWQKIREAKENIAT